MTQTTPTCLWNDSAALEELTYSMEHGAVGATCNPVIVLDVLNQEMHLWKGRIAELIRERSSASEREIAWALVEEISATRAGMLKHIFDAQKGRNGRLSIQTDPILYRNTEALINQAARFGALAPNMIVKIPATTAGIAAFEEVTYRGVSVNATVSFSLPQCVAVAEAVERGLQRRERDRLDISTMGPVCTIMVGRLDDWLKVQAEKKNISTDPGYLEWAGVAVFKKTYQVFKERRLPDPVAFSSLSQPHALERIHRWRCGGLTPCRWQKRFNASDVAIENRISTPVDPRIVNDLVKKFPDFVRACTEGGIAIQDFDTFGPTARTLRQFIEACHELEGQVREFMIPNPDEM